jgi:hypothetical protein
VIHGTVAAGGGGGMVFLGLVWREDVLDKAEGEECPGVLLTARDKPAPSLWL